VNEGGNCPYLPTNSARQSMPAIQQLYLTPCRQLGSLAKLGQTKLTARPFQVLTAALTVSGCPGIIT
jgi:hypothetical protein